MSPPVRPYYVYARANKCVYVLQHKTQNFRPNYLFLQSGERTFALLLVPREKSLKKVSFFKSLVYNVLRI